MSTPGDPLLNQPPDNISVKGLASQEIDPTAAAWLASLGIIKSGIIERFFGERAASMVDSAATIAAILTGNWDKLMALVGKVFLAAQGEQNSGFYDLAAAVVEDLTGVKVDAAALKTSTFGSGRLAGMETLGSDLYNLLVKEFQPASGDLEAGSSGPAETFLGFLMNFCIRQGNVAAMCEAMPKELGFLSGFRDYGEQMAKNLGLGRLARQALKPLITTLVADPLTYQLQQQYRPKRIGATPAIKKFFRDQTFEQQMRTELAQEGYSDSRIDDLISELRPLLSEADLIKHLFRFGDTTVTVGGGTSLNTAQQLQQRGFSADDVQRLLDVSRPVLEKSEIAVLFTNGIMDHPTASAYLGKLGYDSDTAELVLRAHSLTHQHAHQLGLAELKRAFHNGVIDLLELKAHLTSQGYSADDQQIITLDLLQPTHGKVRQLSLAEIKAGFKAGALTETQAASHLKTLGYSDADVAVIVKTLPGPKAPPSAATPAG
jgi:hypothetical protein